MNAIAAPAPSAPISVFAGISRRVREIIARQAFTPADNDRRLLARTPLAVLGPAPTP